MKETSLKIWTWLYLQANSHSHNFEYDGPNIFNLWTTSEKFLLYPCVFMGGPFGCGGLFGCGSLSLVWALVKVLCLWFVGGNVPCSVDGLWFSVASGGSVLCRTGNNHHSLWRGLCLHSGGIWAMSGFSSTVGKIFD